MDSKMNVYVVAYDEDIDKVFDSYQKADEYINDFDCTWWRYEADNAMNCIWIQKFEVE